MNGYNWIHTNPLVKYHVPTHIVETLWEFGSNQIVVDPNSKRYYDQDNVDDEIWVDLLNSIWFYITRNQETNKQTNKQTNNYLLLFFVIEWLNGWIILSKCLVDDDDD